MSKRIFSPDQIKELLKNPCVAGCTEKSITYDKGFKVEAVKRYRDEGISAREIFARAGFDEDVVGSKTPRDRLQRWLKIANAKGMKALSEEQRGGPGRKRSLINLTDQEKIKALELQNAYLKAENVFLAKLRAKRKR